MTAADSELGGRAVIVNIRYLIDFENCSWTNKYAEPGASRQFVPFNSLTVSLLHVV